MILIKFKKMKKLIKKLRILKRYNVVGVKQSLEDEGATFEDLKIDENDYE